MQKRRGLGCEAGWVSRGVVRACWELGPHRMWGRDLPACVARGPGGGQLSGEITWYLGHHTSPSHERAGQSQATLPASWPLLALLPPALYFL